MSGCTTNSRTVGMRPSRRSTPRANDRSAEAQQKEADAKVKQAEAGR